MRARYGARPCWAMPCNSCAKKHLEALPPPLNSFIFSLDFPSPSCRKAPSFLLPMRRKSIAAVSLRVSLFCCSPGCFEVLGGAGANHSPFWS